MLGLKLIHVSKRGPSTSLENIHRCLFFSHIAVSCQRVFRNKNGWIVFQCIAFKRAQCKNNVIMIWWIWLRYELYCIVLYHIVMHILVNICMPHVYVCAIHFYVYVTRSYFHDKWFVLPYAIYVDTLTIFFLNEWIRNEYMYFIAWWCHICIYLH